MSEVIQSVMDIGQRVRIIDGDHKGKTGTIVSLTLAGRQRVGSSAQLHPTEAAQYIVRLDGTGDTVRVSEEQVEPI